MRRRCAQEYARLVREGRRGLLPWWFQLVGWVVALAGSLVCSVVICLYGFSYGDKRSKEWLFRSLTGLLHNEIILERSRTLRRRKRTFMENVNFHSQKSLLRRNASSVRWLEVIATIIEKTSPGHLLQLCMRGLPDPPAFKVSLIMEKRTSAENSGRLRISPRHVCGHQLHHLTTQTCVLPNHLVVGIDADSCGQDLCV
ncbi:hypothetical protein HPB52_011473 [Rhipicephalus sanguineus]|uniref:Uncharacterized protein n=1 Tax=Rhipicephalus sanguineus TaxID=34632 RepID=A0A9D4PVW6_RHISA|nr:hypothetical protein HPB52_011473 [Rhipicephalus sanguineus]